jgi:glucosamine-6-phosphate deaminase
MNVERIPTKIFSSSEEGSVSIAREIADRIKERQRENKNFVLGLATGSSPVRVYDELIKIHKNEGLSFSNVISFNLDEYYPINPDSLQSYVRFMKEHLFNYIDIKPENIHIPDGMVSEDKVGDYCKEYEKKIVEAGGIDIQLLGIGRTGHIGFNEPGSGKSSRTRLITLDRITRTDAASDFFGEENVPRRAITMGVGTILQARKVILLAWGEAKAAIIKRTIEGNISDSVPATYLQEHRNVEVITDSAAGSELTREKTPWLVKEINWNNQLIRKAVIWLSQTLNKPILKLSEEDYNENGMSSLSASFGPVYNINIQVFNDLQHTITGWPGGKPGSDDKNRPERNQPFPKRVLIFSPHPDDDVISMGGTLLRLVDQGHEVHVAYQTSGNIAVFDDDVIRFAEFVKDFDREFQLNSSDSENIYNKVLDFLERKGPGEIDSPEVRTIKGLIRKEEAKSACRYSGVKPDNIHFLDMPFYETGTVKKKGLGREDIEITKSIITQVKPHQIFAAGDLSDPHGTHRVCLKAVFTALAELENEPWMKDCYVWLYRGAWQEWDIYQIEMAVPLSPMELIKKKRAIFKHQSQKDRPLFPGADQREFWQRAEERNRATARLYDQLGLAEYEAIEAFVKYNKAMGKI